MSCIPKNWTGKHDPHSKIVPPTTDNYKDWTVTQVKKECINRGMSVPKTLKKDQCIQMLIKWDNELN